MNFADREGFIWFNGEFVKWNEAKIHVLTHSLHYGVAVFEGIRAYNTNRGAAIFRLEEHINRLFDSAKLAHFTIPYTKEVLLDAHKEALRLNHLDSAYIRPLAFLGTESMGLHAKGFTPNVIIAAWKWGAYLGEEGLSKGIRVKTSSYRRNHTNSIHPKGKITGHYVNSIMALHEAAACGYDEALLLDHLGFIAEGSGENFFIVKNGEVVTPHPAAVLEGITRHTIMTLCNDLNIPVREANLTRDDAYLADEAFFTGTAAEITPIREIDLATIGAGKPGPITQRLQSAYFDLVGGKNTKHISWLTFVNDD